MKRDRSPSLCDCGSKRRVEACCGRWSLATRPDGPESLMRSRYCAYVHRDLDWLLATWHADHRPSGFDLNAEPRPKWLGLRILHSEQHDADHAVVEFEARYTLQGRAFRLHETSRFERVDGVWYYLCPANDAGDADRASPAPGR